MPSEILGAIDFNLKVDERQIERAFTKGAEKASEATGRSAAVPSGAAGGAAGAGAGGVIGQTIHHAALRVAGRLGGVGEKAVGLAGKLRVAGRLGGVGEKAVGLAGKAGGAGGPLVVLTVAIMAAVAVISQLTKIGTKIVMQQRAQIAHLAAVDPVMATLAATREINETMRMMRRAVALRADAVKFDATVERIKDSLHEFGTVIDEIKLKAANFLLPAVEVFAKWLPSSIGELAARMGSFGTGGGGLVGWFLEIKRMRKAVEEVRDQGDKTQDDLLANKWFIEDLNSFRTMKDPRGNPTAPLIPYRAPTPPAGQP